MREVLTLENMNVATIYKVFEDAFTGYFVDFEKRPDIHIQRWLTAGVEFSLSYGVKIDGKLVAFILHSPREEMAMNLATGVMRNFQGHGLAGLMYERIKRDLPLKGIKETRLEVITKNEKAIRAYEKQGFVTDRTLLSWKGEFKNLTDSGGEYDIRKLHLTPEHHRLSPYPHAFEQQDEVVMRRSSTLELHELRQCHELIAYAVWNPWQMNFVQLAGKNPQELSTLLYRMKLSGEHAGMINVDGRNHTVNRFFGGAGLGNYLSQFEMRLSL